MARARRAREADGVQSAASVSPLRALAVSVAWIDCVGVCALSSSRDERRSNQRK